MITLQCRLELKNREDEEKIKKLMKKWTSCLRCAFNRIIDKYKNGEFEIKEKKSGGLYVKGLSTKGLAAELRKKFGIYSDYCGSALNEAVAIYKSAVQNGCNPKKIIFGGKNLFEKLKKKHLSGKEKEKLKKLWKEKRQCEILAVGRERDKGNRYFKVIPPEFEKSIKDYCMKIQIDRNNFVLAKIKRKVRKGRKDRDKWTLFISKLKEAYRTGKWFPYTVRLKFKNDKFYAFISFEDGLEKENPEITEENGVVGFDLNVSDGQKIAWAEVSRNGNLLSYGSIKMSELTYKKLTAKERENILWLKAHEIVNLAFKEGKAVALENLSSIKRGFFRGDGRAKLRRRLAKWSVKSLVEKIEILARRKGIKVIKVLPSFTSIIGEVKYCPQFLIDRDTAAAYCIGRKALGFKEKIPKNYLKILNDKEKIAFALEKINQQVKELRKKIKKEKNKYKKRKLKFDYRKVLIYRNAVKSRIEELKSLQSSESEPESREPVNLRKEQVRGLPKGKRKLWRVFRATLPALALEKFPLFMRDFSPLRRFLVGYGAGAGSGSSLLSGGTRFN